MLLDQLRQHHISRSAMAVLRAAEEAGRLTMVESVEHLVDLAVPADQCDPQGYFTVGYDVPGRGFVLIPNQHIGSWKVGFAPQWVAREYLARRGASPFRKDELMPSRCPLLGYHRHKIQVEGQTVGTWFFDVSSQPEVGEEAYFAGARILTDFFHQHLRQFQHPELDPMGQKMIQACLDGASLQEYDGFTPGSTEAS